MANKQVTFYATELGGKLKTRMGRISWKFGKGYKDQLTDEVKYADDDLDIYFDNGIFVTDHADQIAYLDIYNSGGTITLSDGRIGKVSGDSQLFRITRQDPTAVGVKIVKETTEVIKEIIPKAVLDLMDLDMKVEFAKRNKVELPKELTVSTIDRVLTES